MEQKYTNDFNNQKGRSDHIGLDISFNNYHNISVELRSFEPEELESYNITHNLTDLWKALGVYEALYQSHGLQAKEILKPIYLAFRELVINGHEYKQYEADNGWGTIHSATNFLAGIINTMHQYPESYISIDK